MSDETTTGTTHERLAGQVAALREALVGMLESYEFCLGDELALSDLTKDVMRGAFVGEAARARAALAAAGQEGHDGE